jgi:transcriptional regulator with XRE-family HTH domain
LNNREALTELLRYKRSLIDPAELGWPKRTRGRHTKGLSQAQVAHAALVTDRTYAQLERGEMTSPSPALLDRVAQALRMDERERTALYVYTLGYAPPVPSDPAAGTDVAPAWRTAVSTVSGHACYVNDVAWNTLAANDEAHRMFPQTPGQPPRAPENTMRWILLDPDSREHHLVDWEDRWALPVAAQLRTAVAAHPENADLQKLDEEVNDDPVAGPLYRQRNVAYVHPDGDARPMRHAGYTPPPGVEATPSRCCDRHAPSYLGKVHLCCAQPLGSPGARLFMLFFEPQQP